MFFFEPLQLYHRPERRHCPVRQRSQRNHQDSNNLFHSLSAEDNHPDSSGLQHLDENGNFQVKCLVAGFKLEELSVDVDGVELIVSGQHKESKDPESVERSFKCRIRLPHIDGDWNLHKVKCELDGDFVEISVPRQQPTKKVGKYKIPINSLY